MVLGGVATLLVFFTLTVVNTLEDAYIPRRSFRGLSVTLEGGREALARIMLGLVELHVEVRRAQVQVTESGRTTVQFSLRTPASFAPEKVGIWLGQQPGVLRFEWE
jgi:hypothetical protein